MYKTARPLFFACETPLHAGSGTDLGIVDLPVQRERHTGFPKLEGSGVKGCIREAFEKKKKREGSLIICGKKIEEEDKMKKAIELAFGPEEGDKHAGALGFTDARLLLFPVKSMKGVFAWVTCRRVLERLRRDLTICGVKTDWEVPPANTVPKGCSLFVRDNKIVLEEYTFTVDQDEKKCTTLADRLSGWIFPEGDIHRYWREKTKKDIVVLSDDEFRDFVNLSTEVVTRTKIDPKTGTVADKSLFTEEYLPQETVLYSLVLAGPIFSRDKGPFGQDEKNSGGKREEEALLDFVAENMPPVIQLGGNATLGKGLVWTSICRYWV